MQKVKIKALVNLGFLEYPDCPMPAGKTAEVSEVVAARMVRLRHGEIVKEEKPAAVIVNEPKASDEAEALPPVSKSIPQPKQSKGRTTSYKDR